MTAAYDIDHKSGIVFGFELTASGWAAETWTWNGQDWSRVSAAGPQGYYTGAAYDPVRHEVVLVDTWSSETWTWSGTQWQKRTPSMEPVARVSPSVAFDPSSKTVILFGGNAPYAGGYLNDTWSWDGSNWTQLHPAMIPPGREHATMTSFGAKGGVLLIGGDNPALLADAWCWNGTSWASVQSAGVRYGAAAIEVGNQIIMFGGWTGADPSTATNDLWSWDGNVWQKQ